MTFINRNNILYISINGIRKSTKLKYSRFIKKIGVRKLTYLD